MPPGRYRRGSVSHSWSETVVSSNSTSVGASPERLYTPVDELLSSAQQQVRAAADRPSAAVTDDGPYTTSNVFAADYTDTRRHCCFVHFHAGRVRDPINPFLPRVSKWNLPSLELRRLHINLIWCYKIIFGTVELACDVFFKLSPSSVTRGHAYKLYKPDSTSAARSHFFACRVINAWNSLPPSTDFRNVNVLKHFFNQSINQSIFVY